VSDFKGERLPSYSFLQGAIVSVFFKVGGRDLAFFLKFVAVWTP